MAVRTYRAALAGIALLAVLAWSGCALRGSGFQYVRDQPTGTYYKIPSDWTVYDHDEVISYLKTQGGGSADPEKSLRFYTTFDASKKPVIDRFFNLDSDHPSGTARVQALSPEEHDKISLSDLRSLFVNVDEGAASGQVEIISYDEIEREGGFRGQRIVFNVASDGGGIFTINQTALLDQGTQRLYTFAIGCAQACYDEHRRVIDEVADSWTVKEK